MRPRATPRAPRHPDPSPSRHSRSAASSSALRRTTIGADERRYLDYSRAMQTLRLDHSRRIAFTLATAVLFGLWFSTRIVAPTGIVVARAVIVGLVAMVGFGLFERW